MKRILLYIGILTAALCIPVQRADVGKLRPVQVVSLYKQGQDIVIETDTADSGRGTTVAEAFKNLEETTPAVIYLDTADFLLVTEDAMEYVTQLDTYLKSGVQLCQQAEPVDPELAAQYLSAHGDLPRLKSWEEGVKLPVLEVVEEKLFLIENSKNNA